MSTERTRSPRPEALEPLVLPSRAEAISAMAKALQSPRGPVLLTGEPGVGKTWLCRRLREAAPASWRWVDVDLGPGVAENDLLKLIAHALGFENPGGAADCRMGLADRLAEDAGHWVLVVDEAHHASDNVLEGLRILGNRMGDLGAFAGIVLVGQTPLARRLSTRPLASLQARIASRVHLRPLDADELRTWLTRVEPGRTWDDDLVDRFLRETLGNPLKVLSRSAWRSPTTALLDSRPAASVRPAPEVSDPRPSSTRVAPPVASGKAPIRLGEGMIEVGWEPAEGPEVQPVAVQRPEVVSIPDPNEAGAEGEETEEVIDDHYAALQAWTEWAKNQDRQPVGGIADEETRPVGVVEENGAVENPAGHISGRAGMRVEGEQEFAPYSQLFTRLRQARENRPK